MNFNINIRVLLRILARVLLASYIIIMIDLRSRAVHVNGSQFTVCREWIQLFYHWAGERYEHYLPARSWAIERHAEIVHAYRILDFFIAALILLGIKAGPFILMIRVIICNLLWGIFYPPTYQSLFVSPTQGQMGLFRQIGIIAACLTLI